MRKLIVLVTFLLFTGLSFGWDVNLAWDTNPPEDNVTHYNVYITTTSGSGYQQINTTPVTETAFIHTNPDTADLVFYAVTAANLNEDNLEQESGFSNEVQANKPIPAPGAPQGVRITVTP